jgi:hypothetical protein
MRRVLVTLSCITLVTALISGAGTANAGVGREQAGTAVSISNNYEAVATSICGYSFNYVQRMTVVGSASAWVPVEFVSPPGHFGMSLVDVTCEGYNVYVLDTSCGCQFVAFES